MRHIAWILLFLLYSSISTAQRLLLDSYTPANGLIDSRVTKVFQDSKGKMYFLTRDGFSIYDGRHFDNYNVINGTPVGIVNDIIENSDQSITIFGFDGNRFLIKGKTIVVDSSMQHDLLELNRVIKIAENDVLYLTNYKLMRETNGKLTNMNFDRRRYNAIYIDKAYVNGKYLVYSDWYPATKGKIFFYDLERQRTEPDLQLKDIVNFECDQSGNIYFCKNKWQQINAESLQKGKLEFIEPWFNQFMPRELEYITLNFDNDGNAWLINYSKGCIKADRKSGELKYYAVADGLNYGLSQVFQDKENNYWFFSLSQGVQKLLQSRLTSITSIDNRKLSTIGHVNNTETGNCYLSSSSGQFIIDENRVIDHKGDRANFCRWMNQSWQMKDNRILLSDRGLSIDIGAQLKDFNFGDNQLSYKTTIDREGRLVIGGRTLLVIDKSYQYRVKSLPYFTDEVLVDDQNNYWCFLRSNYLIRIKWGKDSLEQDMSIHTPGLNPRSAVLWKANSFLVGTRYGGIHLVEVNGEKAGFAQVFGKAKGLSNDFVQSIVKRSDNELVIGTATGLDVIRLKGNDTIIEKISAKNNVFSAFPEMIKDTSGVVYAKADDETLYKLEKSDAPRSNFIPTLNFRSITVNGNPVNPNVDRVFNYRKNNFIFSASAPSFLDSKNIRFLFSLSQGQQNWTQHSEAADFSINNLEPGSYVLKITVSFPGKIYPDEHIDYSFTVQPPFWRSWWFIVAALVGTVSIIVLAVRSYFRKQLEKQRITLEKQQAIEKERTRIATDMHDDFGASLSRIKFLSEKLQLKEDNEIKLQEDLTKISAYSDEMTEKMGEIVWALNERYDSSGDLVSFCRSYASEFLEDKNIELNFSTGTIREIKINGEIRRNIFLTLKEALNNIVKHSHADRVDIDISCDAELKIVIADNGKGFDPARIRPFANGIANMKKRIEEIKGNFQIENNNGTRIIILLNTGMPQNAYG